MSSAGFILAINTFVAAAFALAFLVVAYFDRARSAAYWFALTYASGMLYLTLEFVIAAFPSGQLAQVLVFASFLGSLVIFNIGLANKYSVEIPWRRITAVIIASLAIGYAIQILPRTSVSRSFLYQMPSHDPTDFAANFSGRLQSLARAHSLLSSTNWSGTRLVQLIQDQRHVSAIEESRLSIFGPDVYLPPQLALHLALILHELTTNAQKHGALSSAKGRIDLNWVFDGETLQLEWNEAVGRPIEPPRSKRGFGTSLIERSTAAEGGTARCTYGPETMTWVMTFSLSKQSAYSTPSYRLDTAHQKQTVKA